MFSFLFSGGIYIYKYIVVYFLSSVANFICGPESEFFFLFFWKGVFAKCVCHGYCLGGDRI